ncbi:MAG: DUF2855 family protein [Bacteroidota bacterium]
MQTTNFLVHTQDFSQSKFDSQQLPELDNNQILFQIEKYAFTSNNITYAVTGHQLKYWKFFPAEKPWGRVPAWGYAKVVASKHPDVQEGMRFYGYLPMSSYLVVEADKVTPYGFKDMTSHRQEMAAIYNFYTSTAHDPAFHPQWEDYIPIIRPLFATSFLSYHFLKDEAFFQTDNILLTSASSKTALGLAFMLKQQQAEDKKQIIGLTSARNKEFVEKTGFYDLVIAYDKMSDDLPTQRSIIVDFAGNSQLMIDIHSKLGEQLLYISRIGLTDWQGGSVVFRHPNSHFFFAPTQAQKMYKAKGVQETNLQIGQLMQAFVMQIQSWMELSYVEGNTALQSLYQNMLSGDVNPKMGYIVRIS